MACPHMQYLTPHHYFQALASHQILRLTHPRQQVVPFRLELSSPLRSFCCANHIETIV